VALRVIEALITADKENQYFVFTESESLAGVANDNVRVVATHCSRMSPFSDRKFSRIVAGFDLDVFHSFNSWLPFSIGFSDARKIVTIYDIFLITDPAFFRKYGVLKGLVQRYFRTLVERSIENSDLVVTISNYSAKQILEAFPSAAGKIKVVYLASGLTGAKTGISAGSNPDNPYLLYVGNCRSYKNVPVLVKGFSEYLCANRESGLQLVIAGNDSCPTVKKLVLDHGIAERVKFISNPSDESLRELYSGALAFVLPSREEGFGIPVLEAMEMGVPVIISDAEALLEVANGAALVFCKNAPSHLASLISRVVGDEALRKELRFNGFMRSADFSWEKSAADVKACYEELLHRQE